MSIGLTLTAVNINILKPWYMYQNTVNPMPLKTLGQILTTGFPEGSFSWDL